MDFLYPLKSDRENYVQKTEIPVLSFFTGAGFLDIGFKRAGFKIIWRNEVNQIFARYFTHGMLALTGSSEESRIDSTLPIENLSSDHILAEAFHNTQKPQVFGVIGGPPCPDFSAAGKNRGREGDHGKLLRTFIEKISEIQPTFFLIENVLGLVRTKIHRQFLQELLDSLSEKYAISISMLNSLEFGVAQDRYRIFIAGILRDWLRHNSNYPVANNGVAWKRVIGRINSKVLKDQGIYHQADMFPEGHWFPWPEDKRYINARTIFKWPGMVPFGSTPEMVTGIPQELMVGPLICNQGELKLLANADDGFKPYSERFHTVAEGDVSGKSFKRLHRWRYSPTAAYGNNEVHLHPCEPRRLTVREAFRIQSVPDRYEFPPEERLNSKFKMIGNGVPVRLAEAVGFSFASALKGNFNNPLSLDVGDDEE